MNNEKRFLMDVGMQNLPFPIRAVSRDHPDGQQTIARISIEARIMHEFEARWIDTFIQILHSHRDRIGTATLRGNIADYLNALKATAVTVILEYPFFIEKITPKSREKCLVKYDCAYCAKLSSIQETPKIRQRLEVPAITTDPASSDQAERGLYGQLSKLFIEIETLKDCYPEDIVDIVDKHALAPVYSFLTPEDQQFVIQQVHSRAKTSVVVLDEIKDELARDPKIEWYSVRCENSSTLHTHKTMIGTEKSMWIPFSGARDEI